MSSLFPENIDFYSDKEDQVTDVRAADINDLQDAVMAIEQTLGTNPQGEGQSDGWTLSDRLDVFINSNGSLKGSAITSSDIPSGSIINTKIYHDDTFEFKSIKVGQHSDGYGYTGNSSKPGVTIDSSGNLFSDTTISTSGNFIVGNGIIPDIDSQKDIGASNKRFRYGYINTVVGQSTGTENLTVLNSAQLCGTLNIKPSGDLTYGDSVGFFALDSDGNLELQSATSKDLHIQPFEGDLKFGVNGTKINEDVYNFNMKYPYVTDKIQQQIAVYAGEITEITAVLDTTSSASSGASACSIDVLNSGDVIGTGTTYSFNQVSTTARTIFPTLNTEVSSKALLSISIKELTYTSSENLNVQIKVRRT